MEFIQRVTYNRMTVIGEVIPGVKIYDVDLNAIETEELAELNAKLNADTTSFSWVKGSGVTFFAAPESTSPVYEDLLKYESLLKKLGIKVKTGAKLMKRNARFFSDRDVVAHVSMDSMKMEVVAGDKFTRYTYTTTQQLHQL